MLRTLVICCALFTAGWYAARAADLRDLPSPAGALSGEASLCAIADRVYLSWIEATGTEHQGSLYFSVLDGETWSPRSLIYRSDELFINWADFPKLAVAGSAMMAAWLEKLGGGSYAYGVRYARSNDNGRTWSAPDWLHEDRAQTEHGFISLTSLDDRTFGALWLDGRAMVDGGAMQLRFRVVPAAGAPGPETVLDDATCECCGTGLAMLPNGPAAVYRNKTSDHLRDIYLARRIAGVWQPGVALNADGWMIQGCPVNGPSLAAAGNFAAAAWFTAVPGPRVRLAISRDGGRRFGEPLTVSENALGRVDLAVFPDGRAAVTWIEAGSDSAAVMLALYAPETGLVGGRWVVDQTPSGRSSGFPRLVRTTRDLVIAYRDPAAVRIKIRALALIP